MRRHDRLYHTAAMLEPSSSPSEPDLTRGNPRPYGMPPFAQVLSDADIAAVVTYIRVSWGNHGQQVRPSEVNSLRTAPILD